MNEVLFGKYQGLSDEEIIRQAPPSELHIAYTRIEFIILPLLEELITLIEHDDSSVLTKDMLKKFINDALKCAVITPSAPHEVIAAIIEIATDDNENFDLEKALENIRSFHDGYAEIGKKIAQARFS